VAIGKRFSITRLFFKNVSIYNFFNWCARLNIYRCVSEAISHTENIFKNIKSIKKSTSSVHIVAFKEVTVGEYKHISKLGYSLMPIMGANINLGDPPKPTGSAEGLQIHEDGMCACAWKGQKERFDDIVITFECQQPRRCRFKRVPSGAVKVKGHE